MGAGDRRTLRNIVLINARVDYRVDNIFNNVTEKNRAVAMSSQ